MGGKPYFINTSLDECILRLQPSFWSSDNISVPLATWFKPSVITSRVCKMSSFILVNSVVSRFWMGKLITGVVDDNVDVVEVSVMSNPIIKRGA